MNQLTAVHTQINPRTHTDTHMHCSISYMHMCYISIYVCLLVCVYILSPRFDSMDERKLLISSRALQSCLSTFVSPPHTHTDTHIILVSVLLCALCSLFCFRFVFVDCLHCTINSIACSVLLLSFSDHALNIIFVKQQQQQT